MSSCLGMAAKKIPALFLVISAIVARTPIRAQLQTGFISIDCGAPVNFKYVDIDTGISYESDGAYADSGVNRNISEKYAYPNNHDLPMPLSDLRSFPHGTKNCYTLRPAAGRDNLYLIRASFLYGNYDGNDRPPRFGLYLDANLWSEVEFRDSSEIVTKEIIGLASSDAIYVCLVNVGLRTPFISGLELRPLNRSIYSTEYGKYASLLLYRRFNIGSTSGSNRYSDDIYDRIWSSYLSSSWEGIDTSLAVNPNENGYRAPSAVIQTAARPANGTNTLELYWSPSNSINLYVTYLYFAEIEKILGNGSRKYNITWDGSQAFGPFSPRYLYATTISNSKALTGSKHQIVISRTEDSGFPPILNAIEIYQIKQLDEFLTFSEDVAAMYSVKMTYRISNDWVGDPCGPKKYSWEGLACNYSTLIPRVIHLNLSSSGLNGTIASAFAKLSALQSLDLSNNSLTGAVPDFLEELELKFLNLRGNYLSGNVPTSLIERSNAGLLSLSVDEQNLCESGSCKSKRKFVIPLITSLSSAGIILLVALMALCKVCRKSKSEKDSSKEVGHVMVKRSRFTYTEVVDITKNFQTIIGKGGFGNVYLGLMKDGVRVAVKMLSPSSSQGPNEFQTEAELLLRIHHKNLAPFIGYCDEGKSMALIYEYVANGNLKSFLSGVGSRLLTWELRLRILIDAAQGLEYLHDGCKPPIVHRDIKTSNILLTETLDAKIADFGLSKVIPKDHKSHVVTAVVGTMGYLDPVYYNTRRLTEKSDVYSFGIVLLELITGQPVILEGEECIHILEWVNALLDRGDATAIFDPTLKEGEFNECSIRKALGLAIACTLASSLHRPTMNSVLSELKQCQEMELSRERERSSGGRQAFHGVIMPNSTDAACCSVNLDSMTDVSGR